VPLEGVDQPTDQPNGQPQTVTDQPQPGADQPQLVDHMQDQIDYLRRQLEVWQEEARRKDHIIAALTNRIPELEPAKEASLGLRESDLSPSEGQDGAPATPGEAEAHFWWRRFFGLQ
jgi:hypothetical protein